MLSGGRRKPGALLTRPCQQTSATTNEAVTINMSAQELKILRTTNTTSATKPGRSLLTAFLGTPLPVARAVYGAWRKRREAGALRHLDERMLADLGLTRADVDRAFNTPWYQDPSQELNLGRIRNRARRFWPR